MYEINIRLSLFTVEDLDDYMKERGHLQYVDDVRGLIVKNTYVFDRVLAHKDSLGISNEVVQLWRSRLSGLENETRENSTSICMAFLMFVEEMKRLESIVYKQE